MSTSSPSPHEFHIPVLGTGFSIDTPIRVAPYGIDSVMSLVDDELLEQARRHHCGQEGIPYTAIPRGHDDYRAQRTQAYLDLVDAVVKAKFEKLRAGFPEGAEARRYFDLLPAGAERDQYAALAYLPPGAARDTLKEKLRAFLRPGSADVNIMTKLDRIPAWVAEKNPFFSDASASLRGFALSTLESSVVFSAGINPRLFDYLATFDVFHPDESGFIRKRIAVKVSDYRSAFVQGVQLAKKGLWVSEFRVESGLNCGGHVFPTKGTLLGPILEEFVERRDELTEKIYAAYRSAVQSKGRAAAARESLTQKLTAQGGVGTAGEHDFLRRRYGVSGVGWGTPFLLVPEATNVDEGSLKILAAAGSEDVVLSQASPLGVPFWIVKNCDAEQKRKSLVAAGKPGTTCPKGYLAMNEEFGTTVCTASAAYQSKKLRALEADAPEATTPAALILERLKAGIVAKACLCRDLASSFTKKAGLEPTGTTMLTAGPNLASFSAIYKLADLVAHIYGRINLISLADRPHFFIAEARLYLQHLAGEVADATRGLPDKGKKYFADFYANISDGLDYYEKLSAGFLDEERTRFREALAVTRAEAVRLFGLISALPEAAP